MDDEKRIAAETIRNCLLSVAKSSIAQVESVHAVKDWWRKGSIVNKKDDRSDIKKIKDPSVFDGATTDTERGTAAYDENLQWVSKNVICAKGISKVVKEIRHKSDRVLDKKLKEQVGFLLGFSLSSKIRNIYIESHLCALVHQLLWCHQ